MKMKMRIFDALIFFLIFHAFRCLSSDTQNDNNVQGDNSFILYTDVKPTNRSESLFKIRNVPLVYYKFKYDSVSDRSQMGVLGLDAQKWFPESIEVVPSYTFSSKDRSKASTVLTNFPIIDKNVIFMHGVAALQELILMYEDLRKDLDSSKNSEEELQNLFVQIESKLDKELNKQMIDKLKLAQAETGAAKKQLELLQLQEENEKLSLQAKLDEERALLEFEEELSKRRMQQQEDLARETMHAVVALERELAEEREKMRTASSESLLLLKMHQSNELEDRKLQFEKEKIKTEMELKMKYEQSNEDIALRKVQVQSQMETERMMLVIQLLFTNISVVVREILFRPGQLALVAGVLLLLVAVYYSIREFAALVRHFLQAQIGKPSLIRETSVRWSWLPLSPFSATQSSSARAASLQQIVDHFRDVILPPEDKARVVDLAVSTRNSRRSGAPYRHVLLHGPPGNGKTLIARHLAVCSGMDYAIMSGGDVAPLGEEAVNQLHALFKWASRSKHGLLLFIDEAEAFLATRGSVVSSHGSGSASSDAHIRNALNALLYQTGKASTSFMMVLATNHPQDIDPAILDRIDVSLQISLPLYEQRFDLTKYYIDLYVSRVAMQSQKKWSLFGRSKTAKYISDECLSDKMIADIAKLTDGFSGREIAKLFISAQYAMLNAENTTLTVTLLQEVLEIKLRDHKIKSGGFTYDTAPGTRGQSHSNRGSYPVHDFEEVNPMIVPPEQYPPSVPIPSGKKVSQSAAGVRRRK